MARDPSNQRRRNAPPPPPPPLTLTEMEPTHHADHRAFMLKFGGTRLDVTVTNKAEAVRRKRVYSHANKLEKVGIQVANIHDVNAFLPPQENRSYKQVIEASPISHSYHGFDLDSDITHSDWSKPALDLPQISQAAVDAFLRYKIGVQLVR
ncbi:unnamed protein product [Eruca vesicaria subsp. sativa]|uniref:Uncharacterized protein n=1 Tax=Eruca vesicaria subsp. sativa TaxID=29727 RepID=A0ABC8IZT0_ERUVS|nr:unnamed protein product [Eruca vesicaria subsp. sativa]